MPKSGTCSLTFWMMASCGIKCDVWACLMASFAKFAPSSPTGYAAVTDRHTNRHKTTFILLNTEEYERDDKNNLILISFRMENVVNSFSSSVGGVNIKKCFYVNFTFLVLILTDFAKICISTSSLSLFFGLTSFLPPQQQQHWHWWPK